MLVEGKTNQNNENHALKTGAGFVLVPCFHKTQSNMMESRRTGHAHGGSSCQSRACDVTSQPDGKWNNHVTIELLLWKRNTATLPVDLGDYWWSVLSSTPPPPSARRGGVRGRSAVEVAGHEAASLFSLCNLESRAVFKNSLISSRSVHHLLCFVCQMSVHSFEGWNQRFWR